ncbi:deoxyhypusine synthase [Candidatus Woesearchaeota archaeon]|nr:deoxyhypusine synthase [Candidatus Woesearchaeota archaeon]MBW3021829.1 deoxyhypusine synthase [Candidatus Woesearchaeota archaeon]
MECPKLNRVKHIEVKPDMKVKELVWEMTKTGVFGAGRLGKACHIFKDMVEDKECKIFFGLAGAMVPAGMKRIVIDMINDGIIDVLVTTGANMVHDLIETLGHVHEQGTNLIDDSELFDKGIDRIYDVFLSNKGYEDLEPWLHSLYDKLEKKKYGIRELLKIIGDNIDSDDSILAAAARKNIPIFCPGISDSAIGFQTWGYIAKGKELTVDTFEDMKEIMDLTWGNDKTGVFIIGGGVPKDFILQAMQFSPKTHNYAVQITMDREETGGLSGAPLREAVSWGKISKDAKYVTLHCDATIALPIVYSFVKK